MLHYSQYLKLNTSSLLLDHTRRKKQTLVTYSSNIEEMANLKRFI